MQPDIQAARDSLAAFAGARNDHFLAREDPDVLAVIWQDGRPVKLMRADLRRVLDALDDEPPAERCRLCGGDVAKNALAPLCDGAPHARADAETEAVTESMHASQIEHLANRLRALLDDCWDAGVQVLHHPEPDVPCCQGTSGPIGHASGERYIRAGLIRGALNGTAP